jgi:Spy/CpxP family protein refolding chaperone
MPGGRAALRNFTRWKNTAYRPAGHCRASSTKEPLMDKVKRITLATLLGGLAAGVGFKALAHGGWRRGAMHGPIDPAELEQRLDRMLKHLYVEIDATEEQKQKLEPIVKQAAKDLAPMRESLHAGRREAIELLTQDRIDAAAIEALRAKQIGLADQASQRLTRALADAAEVLTPEQRKGLAAHFARRHYRHWGHG